MRYQLLTLIPFILFGEISTQTESFDLNPPDIALCLTVLALATTSSFQAGRVLYHAYARDRKTIHAMPANSEIWPLSHDSKAFLCGAAGLSLTFFDFFGGMGIPCSPTWYLIYPLTAISQAVCDEKITLGSVTPRQSIIFGLAGIATYMGTWQLMKRSAEWYIHKRGVVRQQKIKRVPKKEVTLPSTAENLQTEALFTAALENQARTWYAKLDSKNHEQCPICYDPIQPNDLHITRCEQPKAYSVHYYHTECITGWQNKKHSDCPTCRGTMLGFRMPAALVAAGTTPRVLLSRTMGWIKNAFN